MCDGRLFDAQMRALGAKGHACSAADLSVADTIEGIAERILSHAPAQFTPVGLSMGGIVALELYRQAPERIGHLCLLGTTYHKDKIGQQRDRQLSRVRAGELDLVLRDELKPNYMHPGNRTPERLELLIAMADDLGAAVFETQTRALSNRHSYANLLAQVECPTLIIVGEQDTVCPPALHRDMAAAIHGSHLDILPDCGHLSALEKPDAVSAALLDLITTTHTDAPGTSDARLCGIS